MSSINTIDQTGPCGPGTYIKEQAWVIDVVLPDDAEELLGKS